MLESNLKAWTSQVCPRFGSAKNIKIKKTQKISKHNGTWKSQLNNNNRHKWARSDDDSIIFMCRLVDNKKSARH